jgi:hypothetical protein
MPTTPEQFRAQFLDIQEDIRRDYDPDPESEEITMPSACHVMHRDLGLGQTQREDAAEVAARLSEERGEEIDPSSLDFTEEHVKLHGMLDSLMVPMAMTGMPPEQLLALVFAVGRRYGLREASGALENADDWSEDLKTLDQWLGENGSDTADPRNEQDER